MNAVLLIAVISYSLEEKAIGIAREEGAAGVTILPGRGISFPEHVTFFGLTYRGMEKVLLWVLDVETGEAIANRLNRELDLLQPFQGLAFCLPVDHAEGVDAASIRQCVEAHRKASKD